jgi:DNA polymerase (family 10)
MAEMAEAAKELGYEYLAITDHSKSVAMAKGLNEKRLGQQIRQIDKLNGRLGRFRLLKGCEVDILADGSLDLDDSILKELDVTVCSVHSRFNLSPQKQTERILRAMDNPNCKIIGHPTGRLIGRRDPYQVDVERLIRAAAERRCFLELNAQPDRLDLADVHCKLAMEHGVKIAISTDAHRVTDLTFMRYGVGQARRGWLEADDVINTRKWSELQKLLRRK